MKKSILMLCGLVGLSLFFLTFAPVTAEAQAQLGGEYAATATAAVPEDGGYASVLNPGNVLELKDFTLNHEVVLKLSGGDGETGLDLWFSAGNGTGFSPSSLGIMSEVERLYSIDLRRASVFMYAGDSLRVELGRQSLLTGYGYGWNPMDLANPPKDPTDPTAELTGVDALTVNLFPYGAANLKLYALLDNSEDPSSADYDEIMAGGELTVALSGFEFKLNGLLSPDLFDDDAAGSGGTGSGLRTSALGAGVFADLAGIGIYGEAALFDGSRTAFPDESGAAALPTLKDELLVSALGGLQYTFPGELSVTAEYFYNGEGFDEEERADYLSALEGTGVALGTAVDDEAYTAALALYTALAELYRPGYFSRHYALLNLLYPMYDVSVDLTGTVIFSPDSGALTVVPGLTWYSSGSLSLEARYSGSFSVYGEEDDEAAIAPFRHAVSVVGRFSF